MQCTFRVHVIRNADGSVQTTFGILKRALKLCARHDSKVSRIQGQTGPIDPSWGFFFLNALQLTFNFHPGVKNCLPHNCRSDPWSHFWPLCRVSVPVFGIIQEKQEKMPNIFSRKFMRAALGRILMLSSTTVWVQCPFVVMHTSNFWVCRLNQRVHYRMKPWFGRVLVLCRHARTQKNYTAMGSKMFADSGFTLFAWCTRKSRRRIPFLSWRSNI